MKCFYHREKDSAAVCDNCGKELCVECAKIVHPSICEYADETKNKGFGLLL